MGSCLISTLWLQRATDHRTHCRLVLLTKLDGGLLSLHEAEEDAISWLKMTATKALAKWMNRWLSGHVPSYLADDCRLVTDTAIRQLPSANTRTLVSEQCFTSPPTQYRLYGRRFLQVKRPNQQYQSTEGDATKEKENNDKKLNTDKHRQ